jgi:hypothetical protein
MMVLAAVLTLNGGVLNMANSDLVTLRNNSNIPQSVIFKGRQIVLDKYAEQKMDAEVAQLFLEKCADVVNEVQQEAAAFDPDGANDVWVANVTGHPKYAPKVQVKTLRNKKWEMTEVVNPSAQPHPVKREYDHGQEAYVGKDGSYMSRNLPPQPIEILPFQRRLLRKDVADWYLRREGVSVQFNGFSRAVIKSRKPSSYEPDMSWDLNEMRAYLKIISAGQEAVGPSEEELADAAKDQIELDNKLHEAKAALIKTLWFYVCDPAYRYPTRAEVRELLAAE